MGTHHLPHCQHTQDIRVVIVKADTKAALHTIHQCVKYIRSTPVGSPNRSAKYNRFPATLHAAAIGIDTNHAIGTDV